MWYDVGPRWEANPEYTGSPGVHGFQKPRAIVPEVGTPEDSDESDRSDEGKMRSMRLYHSDAKEGKCDYKSILSVKTLCFVKAARAYNHKHISIAYLLYYVAYMSMCYFMLRNKTRMSLIMVSEWRNGCVSVY